MLLMASLDARSVISSSHSSGKASQLMLYSALLLAVLNFWFLEVFTEKLFDWSPLVKLFSGYT